MREIEQIMRRKRKFIKTERTDDGLPGITIARSLRQLYYGDVVVLGSSKFRQPDALQD